MQGLSPLNLNAGILSLRKKQFSAELAENVSNTSVIKYPEVNNPLDSTSKIISNINHSLQYINNYLWLCKQKNQGNMQWIYSEDSVSSYALANICCCSRNDTTTTRTFFLNSIT
jgi:hypothetical protein